MNAITHPAPDPATLVVTRVAADQWHALDDDLVVGRGHTSRRPDGRLFVSVDAWHDTDFDRLAAAMLAELPAPLYTVVDADDPDPISNWHRAGFTAHRRERQYLVPTETPVTERPPAGVTVTGRGGDFLAHLEGDDIGATRVLPLLRSDGTPRIARIVSVEVRADHRRRGIGRALLTHALHALHHQGFAIASADVDESDTAAIALLEGLGARRASSSLELTWEN